MISLIERGANQIVHGGVRNDEGLCAVALDVQHASDERARLRDEETSWLKQQAARESFERLIECRSIFMHFRGSVESAAMIVDAQTASSVYRANLDSGACAAGAPVC